MTAEKDYYRLLGVSRLADDITIKKAYRALARKYHPDVSSDKHAALILSSINEAYEVLSDPSRRARYHLLYLNNEEEAVPHFHDINEMYSKIVALRKETVKLNKYRMNKEALFYRLYACLSNENIAMMHAGNDEIKKKNLVAEALDIAALLSYNHQKIIAAQLLQASIDQATIQHFLREQRIAEFFKKYGFLLAIAGALLLVGILIKVL